MFIYNHNYRLSLLEYGISIPICDSRLDNIYNHIKSNSLPIEFLDEGNLENIFQLFTYAHHHEYITTLMENPERTVTETFELIKDNGSYNRFDPLNAKRKLAYLTHPFFLQTLGTLRACEIALSKGIAYNLGGGFHHAMNDCGRGFCLINDLVIAARKTLQDEGLDQIWIIDLDAHKGDGTANLTQNEDRITTLSIHMETGWPLDSHATPQAFTPSNIDIPIASNKNEQYLMKLEEGLKKLQNNFPKAQLTIVVNGSDPYENDALESSQKLKLTQNQLLERNKLVYHFLKDLEVPQAYVTSGGYGEHAHEPDINFINYLFQ